MKKILIPFTVIVAMLCSMGGMVYADDAKGLLMQTEMSEFVPGTVPAQSGRFDGMIPPLNAMVMSMLEQGLDYDESDDVFVWNSLHYMIGLYGQMDSRTELDDKRMILPAETVEDYAAALFTNYDGLPKLPGCMKDRVAYDAQNDSYSLARGDAGLSEVVIRNISRMDNGAVAVSGVMAVLEDESALCGFTAILTANNSMFGYSITDLNIA